MSTHETIDKRSSASRPDSPAGALRDASGSILIVDDEFSVRDSLANWFRKDGLRVAAAACAPDALRELQAGQFDVALLDIRMPGTDGMELLPQMRTIDPNMAVIMITAYAAVETAVQALKMGAFDYVTKPIDPDELSHLVRHALEKRRLRDENAALRERMVELAPTHQIVGESAEIRKVLDLVQSVAQTSATVLIRGESGTGKELVARAIHASGPRRYFPIIPVNCGALPEGLLESELFGHERGAFTGAQYRRKGRFEMADGGTLFLDEIGTLTLKTQVDLLRVLETKEFTRLGGSRPLRVDFRTICATNQSLEKLVEAGQFREDLYYRVNVFSIYLPPLRERRADIPLLAQHFLQRFAVSLGRRMTEISPEAMDVLVQHRWPGNIRELANAIERAVVIGKPPAIRPEDLPIQAAMLVAGAGGDSLAEVERRHIARILEQTHWNMSKTAEILGVDRATVYNKVKRYQLRR
jgi:DNA-binding NtrC family response regulator